MDFGNSVASDWDEGNARKNEKHGVTQAEVEQVFLNAALLVVPDSRHSESESRYHALGRTDANRWLHVTFTLRDGGRLVRPISARDMHRKEKPFYEQALKNDTEV